MSLETEVAALTEATTDLLVAVNQGKANLDSAVAEAEAAAATASTAVAAHVALPNPHSQYAPATHTHTASQISDSTATGRALLTGAALSAPQKAEVRAGIGFDGTVDDPIKLSAASAKIRASIAAASNENVQSRAPWCAAPTWAQSTSYANGQIVRGQGADASNLYLMAGNDTAFGFGTGVSAASGTGPSGTGFTLISDGTCRWNYIGKATAGAGQFISNATLSSAASEMNGALQVISTTEATNLGLTFYQPKAVTGSYSTEAFITGGVFNPTTGRVKGPNFGTVASPSYPSSLERGRVILCTNSVRFIAFRVQPPVIYNNRVIDFVVNGRLLSESQFSLPAVSANGSNILLLNMAMFGPGEKMIEIHIQDDLQSYGAFEIGLEQDATVWPKENPNRFKMTFEGDSICQGSFFSGGNPRFRLDRIVAEMIGCDHHYNNAVGGTGAISDMSGQKTTYAQRFAGVQEFGSDIHVICGFHNDTGDSGAFTSASRRAAFLSYLQQCRTNLPKATIVLLGALPLRGDLIAPGGLSLHQVELDAKFAFDTLADTNALFIPIFTSSRQRITSTAVGRFFMNATAPYNDGHPTPVFYYAMGQFIAEKVKAFFAS